MDNKPLVSICIPVLNTERYIEETVNSASIQTYENIEIICVDNNSTDETYHILKRLQKDNKNLKVYKNKETISMYDNFNKTLEYINGKYIKFLCADDLLHPECVKEYVEVMETYPDVGLVTSKDYRIDEHGKFISSTHPLKKSQKINGKKIIKNMFRNVSGTFTKTPTHVMYRNCEDNKFTLIEKNDSGWGIDIYKWMQILSNENYYFINKDLVSNRVHEKSYSCTEAKIKKGKTLQEYYNFFIEFFVNNRQLFSFLDLIIFKKNFKLRAKQFGVKTNDINDWEKIL